MTLEVLKKQILVYNSERNIVGDNRIGLALVGVKDEEEAAKIRREKKEKIKKHQEEMRLQMMQGRMPQRPPPDAFAESNF